MKILETREGSRRRLVWRSTPAQHVALVRLLNEMLPPGDPDVVVTVVLVDRFTGPLVRVTSRPASNVESARNGRRQAS